MSIAIFFFFSSRRRHTRLTCDWSSDVCSSDLCPYHGWKYDVTGQCIDVPSEPVESGFCNKIKLKSYPLVERGGILWAYMGPSELQPPAPAFEWSSLPASHGYFSKRWQECNFLQAMEGRSEERRV